MASFSLSLTLLKDVVGELGLSVRVDDSLVNKSVYTCLTTIERSIQNASDKDFSNESMAVLEDVCNGKLFSMTRSLQNLLLNIYTGIILKAPGFVNRNILNAMLAICNNKTSVSTSRECAILIIGILMEFKSNDCGSQINESILCIGKLIKSSDIAIRIATVRALTSIVVGSGSKIGDLHGEIVKLAVRVATDKVPDVRQGVALLLKSVAGNSLGCTTVPSETLLAPCVKGLEDEVAIVQDAFADALAGLFAEQISVHAASQEQAKYGQARGGGSDKTAKAKPAPSRMSITRLSSAKKVVEDYDFKTVAGHLLKQVAKTAGNLRSGYLAATGYLIRDSLEQQSPEDFEWLVSSMIGALRDPAFAGLSYEEGSFLKARFSHLIRSAVTAQLTEARLLVFGSLLSKFSASMDAANRSELELQLAFSELSHVVTVLGAAAVPIVDEVNAAATVHLRNSSFGVRSAAAHVLSSLSVVAPVVAADILRNALLNARSQAKQLLVFDGSEMAGGADLGLDDSLASGEGANGGTNSTGGGAQSAGNASAAGVGNVARKRSPKEAERLQRMYYFHGHTLVISILLKNARYLPTGLPTALIADIYSLGIELLQHDVFAAPAAVRNVSCSIVRAGSLIVSSCLSLGYDVARPRLADLLDCCGTIFRMASATPSAASQGGAMVPGGSASPSNSRADDPIYEVMSVEAALVCLSTLLLFCPEALSLEPTCLHAVVDGLEVSFRALKSKYQPKYRTHFRFCTLHVVLMECFSWLPQGSYPQSCQQVFVEALRVFRDSIQACFDCTGLSEFIAKEHWVLATGGVSSYRSAAGGVPMEIALTEHVLMLKLESHATALQKRESEAFLAAFGKDNYPAFTIGRQQQQQPQQPHGDDQYGGAVHMSVPCAQIDSRTMDSSVLLLAATFAAQTDEYQDKAIQLCAQAVAQFSKASTKTALGMFSSEEERRKRDRKAYSTMRNVMVAVSAIVQSLPAARDASVYTWQQALSDLLFDLLAQPYHSIRCSAASALAAFAHSCRHSGGPGGGVLAVVSHRIRGSMISALAKKGEAMEGFSGYVLALASLWTNARDEPDVRSLLITTVFDCFNKIDSAVAFRAHCLLALSVIVREHVEEREGVAVEDSRDLVQKTATLIETLVASLAAADELDLLLGCLLRLLSATMALALRAKLRASEVDRLLLVWQQVPSFTQNKFVLTEALNVFAAVIPHDSEGALNAFLFEQFQTVVTHRRDFSVAALASAVEGMRSLVVRAPQEACRSGLDASLFVLLDYCLSCTPVSTLAPYSGVEIRRGMFVEESQGADVRRLMHAAVQALYALVEADVLLSPNTRLVHWVLLCRAVALNLRSIGAPPADGGAAAAASSGGNDGFREQDEDEEEDEDFGGPAEIAAPGATTSVDTAMTYVTFAAQCRDSALSQAPDLQHSRVQLKCVAVRCIQVALAAMQTKTSGQDMTLHLNLKYARQSTNEVLSSLTSGTESLEVVPRPLVLFLTDLVNLGCACATFTLDDKPVLLLQKESMRLLQTAVGLFLDAPDPDIIAAAQVTDAVVPGQVVDADSKLLSQFMSQILSAVRTCLSVQYNADLLLSAGGVLCDLIRGGFVSDKVIARRLLKPLFAALDPVAGVPFSVRARTSETVSEEVAVADHVAGLALMAQLALLTSGGPKNAQVADQVRAAIASLIGERSAVLTSAWFAIVADGARLAGLASKGDEDDGSSSGCSPLRGGVTYPPATRTADIAPVFAAVLPSVLCACSQQIKALQAAQVTGLFVTCAALIQRDGRATRDVDSLLLALVDIARSGGGTIPLNQWSEVLSALEWTTAASSSFRPTTVCLVVQLVSALLTRYATTAGDESAKALVSRMIRANLASIQCIVPGIFETAPSTTPTSSSSSGGSLLTTAQLSARTSSATPIDGMFTASSSSADPSTLSVALKSLVALAKHDPQLAPHAVHLCVLTVVHVAAGAPPSPNSPMSQVVPLVTACAGAAASVLAVSEQQSECVRACQCLLEWCQSMPTEPRTPEVLSAVVDAVLGVWRGIACAVGKMHLVPSPHQLAALVLSTDRNSVAARGVLLSASRFFQAYAADAGAVLAEALLPALLCRLSYPDNDADTTASVARALLTLVSVVSEAHRGALVDMLVVPLCERMHALRDADPAFLSLCGKGFTHLARLCPDAFRGQVGQLSEAHRGILQQVMTQALLQQQQQQQHSEGALASQRLSGSGPPPVALKLDMNKYKK